MSFRPLHRKAALLTFCLGLLPLASARAASTPGTGTAPDPVKEKLADAQKLIAKKDFKRAAAELQDANRLADGQCGACLLGLVQAEVALGERERAIEAAREAVALRGPQRFTAAAYNQLGVTLIQPQADEARLSEAAENLRRAVELGDGMARINLAALELRRHHPDESLALARQYLAAEPQGKGANGGHILVCHARALLAEEAPAGSATGAAPEPAALQPDVQPQNLFRQPVHFGNANGTVELDSVIDEEGCVVDAQVVKPGKAPTLEGPARQAVRFWVFQPARHQGQPVRTKYRIVLKSYPTNSGFSSADSQPNPFAYILDASDYASYRGVGGRRPPG
jgi:TonB family protein